MKKKITPTKNSWIPLALILFASIVCVDAKVLPFNEKKVPETKDDLLLIQQALVDQLPHARAATVGIKLAKGFGSGVIVSAEGLILTAAHVSGGVNKELTVVMNDGSEYKAISMGLLSNTDAAMMRIVDKKPEGKSFPYVEINKNNNYKLGHWVFALGHSGGFDQARGPVVRLGRILQDKESTIQSDCKVIGGDSGGPLFDMEGRLIAIHSRVGRETVIENWHVPMREYLSHWDDLESGKFIGEGPYAKPPVKGSGFLGIGTKDSDEGVKIHQVGEGFAAEKAGLKVGDILVEVGGEKISNKADLKTKLSELVAGDSLEIKISRDGETQVIKLILGER